MTRILGDARSAAMVGNCRTYALIGLARLPRRREVLATVDWRTFGADPRVTLSIGVAQRARGMDGATLYDRADHQLYNAKRRGRDQVSV